MPVQANEIDTALRQAIYYEQVNENEGEEERSKVDEILLLLLGLILGSGIDFTKRVSRRQLNDLLTLIQKRLSSAILAHDKELVARLKTVMATVSEVTKSNMRFHRPGVKVTDAAFDGSTGGNKRLWARITKDYVAGTGIEPLTMIKTAGRSILGQAGRVVKQAFVEKWDTKKITEVIKGTPKKAFKDGLINKIGNTAKTTVKTLGSHINAVISHSLGQIFYETYQWVSTLDAVTTDICRSRHMRVYRYGAGPIPPAHYNCRSVIVGMAHSLANQYGGDWFGWLRAQPVAIQNDALTRAEAIAIRSGDAKPGDFTAYNNTRRLTPAQFGARVSNMQLPSPD